MGLNIVQIGTGIMSVPPVGTGAVENSIYELAENLVRFGLKVDIIDIKNSKANRGEIGATYHEIAIPPLCDVSSFLQVISFALKLIPVLRRLVEERDINLIHTHSQFSGFAALLSKRIFGWKIPLVYTTHNSNLILKPNILNRTRRISEYLVFRYFDQIIALNETIREGLIEHFRISPKRVTKIRLGLELKRADRPNANKVSKDYFAVLYPARICRWKNQMALIEAALLVLEKFPDTKFIIAGPVVEKNYFSRLQRFVRKNNIDKKVVFTGELHRREIYKLYQTADAVAFPSLREVQPIALIEAMAFGVPVVASNIGQIRDIVKLVEGSALLVDPRNSGELGNTIVRIIKDNFLSKELSYKGRKLSRRYFSWDTIANETRELYESLCTTHREGEAP